MNRAKKIISILLVMSTLLLCSNVDIAATDSVYSNEDLVIGTSTTEPDLPSDDEVFGVEASGELMIDGEIADASLDGADVDSFIEQEDGAEDSLIKETIIGENFIIDESTEDLDGSEGQDYAFSIVDDGGNEVDFKEGEPDEADVLPTEGDSELDGGLAPSGYSLSINSSTVKVGSSLKLTCNIRNGWYAYAYFVSGSTVYTARVSSDTYNVQFNQAGTWRIYLIVYNLFGKFDGSKVSNGSLYISCGYAPYPYDMSADLSSDKTAVNFKINSKNADSFDFVIIKDGKLYYQKNHGKATGITFKPTETGSYKAYLITYNKFGSFNGSQYSQKIITFTKLGSPPSGYSWRLNNSNCKIGERINISVTDLKEATSAKVVIISGNKVVAQADFDRPRDIQFIPSSAGTYKAYLITYNQYGQYNGLSKGNVLTFTVTGGGPSAYYMKADKAYINTGGTVNLSIDYRNANYYILHIIKGSDHWQYQRTDKSVPITFNMAGTYRIYLVTYNNYGSYNGANLNYLNVVVKESSSIFRIGYDNYGFSNSPSALGYNYGVDKISLASYQEVFGTVAGWARWSSDGAWGGSCYGFATSAAAVYNKYIGFRQFNSSASCLFNVPAPKNKNSGLTRRLERYQLSQLLSNPYYEELRNKNQYAKLISAIENYQVNGGDPVIICVKGKEGGHAVIGRTVSRDSAGRYIINVCDNNDPYNTNCNIIVSANKNSFSYYNGHLYDKSISYVMSKTVYNALPGNVRTMSLDGEETNNDDTILLSLNVDNFDIVNSNGTSMLGTETGYEIEPVDSNLIGRQFVLPRDKYTIQFKNNQTKTSSCVISDGLNAIHTEAEVSDGTFYIGMDSIVDRIQCSMQLNEISHISSECVNSEGETQKFEMDGLYLGMSISSLGKIQINTDVDSIKQNGTNVDLSQKEPIDAGEELDGGSGTFSRFEFDNNIEDLDGMDQSANMEYAIKLMDSTIDRENGSLTGKIGVAIHSENKDMKECRAYVAVYDYEGRMLGVEKQDVVLGGGSSYFDLNAPDVDILNTNELKVKVFLWNETQKPLSDNIEFSV